MVEKNDSVTRPQNGTRFEALSGLLWLAQAGRLDTLPSGQTAPDGPHKKARTIPMAKTGAGDLPRHLRLAATADIVDRHGFDGACRRQ